jgi:hypothetical protein
MTRHEEREAALHARDGQRERCPWCCAEAADETDYDITADDNAGGSGPWLCWGCGMDDPYAQRERAERAEAEVVRLRKIIDGMRP